MEVKHFIWSFSRSHIKLSQNALKIIQEVPGTYISLFCMCPLCVFTRSLSRLGTKLYRIPYCPVHKVPILGLYTDLRSIVKELPSRRIPFEVAQQLQTDIPFKSNCIDTKDIQLHVCILYMIITGPQSRHCFELYHSIIQDFALQFTVSHCYADRCWKSI